MAIWYKAKHQKRTLALWHVVVLLWAAVMLVGSLLPHGLYARYITQADDGDAARVAAYEFSLTEETQLTKWMPTVAWNDDRTAVYAVTVTNYTGDRVCEVKQSYTMTIEKLTDNIPLVMKVYSDEECTQEADAQALTGTMPPATKTEHTYYLKLSLNNGTPAAIADEVDLFRITVAAQQVQ